MAIYEYEIPRTTTTERVRHTGPNAKTLKSYGKFTLNALQQYEPYPGEFIAQPTEAQQESINLRIAQLPQLRDVGVSTMGLGEDMASGRFLDMEQNPYAKAAFSAAVAPVQQDLFQRALPMITSRSMENNSYSGVRSQLAKVSATEAAGRVAGDITSGMALDIYGKERQLQLAAPEVIRQGIALQDLEASQLGRVGQAQWQFEQAELQNDIARWYEKNWGPIQAASGVAPAMSTLPVDYERVTDHPLQGGPSAYYGQQGGSSGSSGSSSSSGGGWGGAVSGVASGAYLGNQLLGPWGALGGGILGGVLGYFS